MERSLRNSKDNQNVSDAEVDATKENETFNCGYCHEILQSVSGLKQHLKRKHTAGEKSFECNFCEKAFKTSTELVIHRRSMHVESQNENGFQCELCMNFFSSKLSLLRHLKAIHEKEYKSGDTDDYKCNLCSKTLSKDI